VAEPAADLAVGPPVRQTASSAAYWASTMRSVRVSTTIRPLAPDDAEAVLGVHYAAVQETAAADYSPEIRHDWSPPLTAERIDSYLRSEARAEETTLVAVVDARIVGFASIVATLGELRAVYVRPDVGRRGVGGMLLNAVEQLARDRGVEELHLDSSLTAVRFYEKHGYLVENEADHVLGTGRRMPCVQMRKRL
jgi:putative acetyltransferase